MSWLKKINFQQSIKEIKEDERRGNDFCVDPLRFIDLNIKTVAKDVEVLARLNIKKFKSKPLIELDVPKSNYILRPGARPNLIDWVSYNAIVNFVGSEIHRQIPYASCSFNNFREKFKRKPSKRRIDHWIDFENFSISMSKKFKFILLTDIVSFFENISLDVLRERLCLLSRDRDYLMAVNFLINKFLYPWTKKNKVEGFGLPQGPTASSVLAEIYLYPVDREMRRNRICFIRYMDDIRIFAKTRQDLKKNMKILVKSLRDLKLNLSAKKTYIYETSDKTSMGKVFDPKKQTLNLIDKAYKSKKRDQIILVTPSVLELFDLSKNPENPFNERYFRFFISHMISLMKFNILKESRINKIATELLDIFEEKHHLSHLICWFLIAASQYCGTKSKKIIKEKLITFILDKDKNIYECQEMWALDAIRQIGDITKREINKLKSHVSSHELCQAQLCLIQAENGSIDEKEEVFEKIIKNQLKNDQYRYYFLATQEMPKNVLKKIENKILKYFRKYVYSLQVKKYGFKYHLEKEILLTDVEEFEDLEGGYY